MTRFLCFFLFGLHFIGMLHASEESHWVENSDKSVLAFSIRNMGFLRVQGKFHDFKIHMTLNEEDLTKSSLQISVDAASIDTGINKRDKHLRDEDFFHIKEYPFIKFKSTGFEHVNKNRYKLLGELSIKNNTHPLALDLEYDGLVKHTDGTEELQFKYKGVVDRFDYGLDWTTPIPTANILMGKSVKIKCSLSLTRMKKH